jgi:ATP-dependent Lon protease
MNNNHKYNTRLSSGSLKRKYIECDNNDSSDDEDYFDELDDSDSENNLKSKSDYYKLLYQLYPSKFSKNKYHSQKKLEDFKFDFDNKKSFDNISSEKKLFELSTKYKKHHDRLKKSQYNYDYDSDNSSIKSGSTLSSSSSVNSNSKLALKKLKKLFSNKKNNVSIILNLKKGKNYINNYGNKYSDDEENIKPFYLYNDDDDDDDDDDENDDENNENNDYKMKDNNKELENEIIDVNTKNKKPTKKESNKNYKNFLKIVENEDDNESEYFKKIMSFKEQIDTINNLEKIKKLTTIEKPYLIHVLELDIPDIYKACALKKINTLRSMGSGFGNSEFYKIKAWIDAFIKIPFNKYNNLTVTFADGIDKCNEFMTYAKQKLDSVAYGLEDAKLQILQMIGLWLVNPNAVGTSIAIKGPPGTGKTTLIKDGISTILERPFYLVALGGCGDSGILDGHDFVYEGSKYGKIIEILIKAQCMNPVILFDELDKISDTPRGAEITGVLIHLTDTTQNSHFNDKYMSEINLDMSRALYIFSYNNEELVNPILKDRMYKIETKGYNTPDKLIISKNYLLPKLREQSKFNDDEIIFSDTNIEHIINNYTDKEDGVRNLKRCFETLFTKLNLYRLMKNDSKLFTSKNMLNKEDITFPLEIKNSIIDKLLIKKELNLPPFGMYN